ncbi:unnamed protein product [Sphagnum tenellum]
MSIINKAHSESLKGQLDVALEGPGFLEVATPDGIRYSRQGSLKISPTGRLLNSQGYPVLGLSADALASAENAGASPNGGTDPALGGTNVPSNPQNAASPLY